MEDLQKIILQILKENYVLGGYGERHLDGFSAVPTVLLKELQDEYNIYFIEPNAQQLDIV
jgi:hypothetical protein